PRKGVRIDFPKMRKESFTLLARLGVSIDPNELVGRLPTSLQQYVEIAKALRLQPDILILDEPTASLPPEEADRLISLLRDLGEQGVTIIYISHRFREIFALCDIATVLRNGALVDTFSLADTSTDELVESMVGASQEKVSNKEAREKTASSEVVLEVEKMYAPKVQGTSLSIRKGEVLGIGGLMGSGRTELLRSILGLEQRSSGTVRIHD